MVEREPNMTSTIWKFQSEAEAARWINLTVKKLREMRQTGRGPVWLRLPSGEIKYRVEDLDKWACSGREVLYVEADSNIYPLPGVRVRVRLPSDIATRPYSVERRRHERDTGDKS